MITYDTEQERKAARRLTWRESNSRRYAYYVRLCAAQNLGPKRYWTSHLAQLEDASQVGPRWDNRHLILAAKNPYARWWLRRFSLAELRVLGRGMYARDDRTPT